MAPLALALHLALAVTGPAAAAAFAPSPDARASVAPDAAPAAPAEAVPVSETGAPAVAPAALAPMPTPAPAPRLRAMTLAPRELDPGPFRPGELVGATFGAFAGDALVLAAGYETLQLFASGAFSPSATNFRRAVYGFGAAALLVPPLTSVLLAKLGAGPHASGSFWKALLLASVGQAAALAAGYYAAPHFWVVLPVQVVALSVGASLGLHWGPSGARAIEAPDEPDAARAPDPAPAAPTAGLSSMPVCRES
ncbi:MAG TPA: hypothetical protein VF841_21435 [Anaeromyxobacter sp.]